MQAYGLSPDYIPEYMPSIGIQLANGSINAALVAAFPLLPHDLKKKKKKKKHEISRV